MKRKTLLAAVVTLAGLLASLLYLTQLGPSEIATVEQLLPPDEVADIERMRSIFGREPDVVLVAVSKGPEGWMPQQIEHINARLRAIDGVVRTWSSVSGLHGPPNADHTATVHTGDAPQRALGQWTFFEPDASTQLFVLELDRGAVQLTRSRALTMDISLALAEVIEAGGVVRVVGAPQLRVASWDVMAEDLGRMFPLLIMVIVVVPIAFFGSLGAVVFPLCMAVLTTACCLVAYHWLSGPPDALVLLLVPLLWSIATLDAMHLYHRVRLKVVRGYAHPFAAAKAELYLPCLITTLTTAGGLAALAVQDDSQLIRAFGVWAAAGTCIAYVLTFTVGSTLLSLFGGKQPAPRWPGRLAQCVIGGAQQYPRTVLAVWLGCLLAAVSVLHNLHIADRFPHVFVPGHPFAHELRAMQDLLGSSLSPIEIYVEATDEHGRQPSALVSGMLAVTNYVKTLPETRAVLPRDLLVGRSFRAAVETAGTALRPETVTARIAALGEAPRLVSWLRFEHSTGRVQVQLAPLSFARKSEILDWLRHFDQTMLSHHRLSFGGAGYHYFVAERQGLHGALAGGALSLLVVLSALAWAFRKPRLWIIAIVGNLIPVVLVAGIMGASGIAWSLALLPLPAVLLGLAVDDSVHLLWPLRGQATRRHWRVYTAGRQSGPPLLATTAILAGCIATLCLSGLQSNRELGLLLPVGILAALLCDLSLIPALLTFLRRK